MGELTPSESGKMIDSYLQQATFFLQYQQSNYEAFAVKKAFLVVDATKISLDLDLVKMKHTA